MTASARFCPQTARLSTRFLVSTGRVVEAATPLAKYLHRARMSMPTVNRAGITRTPRPWVIAALDWVEAGMSEASRPQRPGRTVRLWGSAGHTRDRPVALVGHQRRGPAAAASRLPPAVGEEPRRASLRARNTAAMASSRPLPTGLKAVLLGRSHPPSVISFHA